MIKHVSLSSEEISVLDTLIEFAEENWEGFRFRHDDRMNDMDSLEADFDSLSKKVR